MTSLMKRILMGVVLALALVGALLIGSTVYRLGQRVPLLYLLDETDLRFLHQARVTVEAQQAAPKPPPPKPAEAPPP